ncbi:arylsulfatase [Spirochaeta isovalerica]|uniref:Arylsulfatase A-like enzyme n=1 Tax=Spirochaeta isovalerica TaxID=150 RepID=A0A841RAI7_9SPIO|nr:arylsulfatase [Spirochaeta isovalerica]MBB6479452.1 arylsulfatase A-like enzyme [Spirochaeta isovalerica]
MKYSIFQRAAMVLMMGFMTAKSIYAEKPDDSRPNVIFILADDAGFGDFGSYGQSEILTPNLDRMSEEGIRFTDHYAGAPVCSPSRSALLTGQHTGHTPIRGNKEIQPEGQYPLPAETGTVGTMLQKAGIQTAAIGKWGLGYPGSSGTPDKQGFDYFFGYNCQRQAHDYYPDHIWENEKKLILDGKTYTHDLFTEKALSWIEEERDAPFFLYLAYTIPHAALQVPDLEPYQEKDWPENMKKYAAMITRMDRDIGKILSKLKEQGIDKKTLILFSSDNGPHAEGGADPAYFKSGGPFRGIKRDLYEGGIRIPLIARWPGVIQPERETDHISAFWDFLPTIAEIYSIPLPEGIDGISYLPVLKNQEDNQKEHDYLYWEFHENG